MMSQQISLFGEPTKEEVVVITTKRKPKKPEKDEEDDEDGEEDEGDYPDNPLTGKSEETSFQVAEEIKDDKYGWAQLPNQDERNSHGLNFVSLQLLSTTDLSGTIYAVAKSTEHRCQHGLLGSCYGSGGETFKLGDLEGIQRFFDDIMEMKKNNLQEPYREFTDKETEIKYEHHNIYYDFRLVTAKNFFVVISDKLVEMITKTGFDFDKWYQEYRDLPEHLATDEDWAKAHENLKLMEQGDEICTKLEAIDTILKTNQDLKETADVDFFTKTKEEVIQEFKDLPLRLREISDKIKENRMAIGKEGYYTPFSCELDRGDKLW